MKASKFPAKDIKFVTFRDPDPAGDGSDNEVYETVWIQTKEPFAENAIREKFGQMADNNDDWCNLTDLVEMTMKATHLKWGWAYNADTIDIPF